MLPEGPMSHCKIEFLEDDQCKAIWELKGETLVYTGLVRTTNEVDGLLVSTKVEYLTLEFVGLPMERIWGALHPDMSNEASTSRVSRNGD
jgi:hypothetical protein